MKFFKGIFLFFSQLDIIGWIYTFLFISFLAFLFYLANVIEKEAIDFAKRDVRRKEKLALEREQERAMRRLEEMRYFKELLNMTPTQFEHYVKDLFVARGYKAKVTKPTGDGGKDIIIEEKDNDGIMIAECKRYNKNTKVTRPDIQKFHSAIIDCNANKGFFITTGEFTKEAIKYAEGKPMTLINGEKLIGISKTIYSLT